MAKRPSPNEDDTKVSIEVWADGVVVYGASDEEVRQAMLLWSAARGFQSDMTNMHADAILTAMTSARISALPEANAELAQRRSTLRNRLLEGGSFSNKDIAILRDIDVSSARTFVARERAKHRLFTVKHGQNTLVPQILLDADGELTAVSRAVEVLQPLGIDGWELWSWLASPSGWLSGDVPAEVFEVDPERALVATRAYATELATTTDL